MGFWSLEEDRPTPKAVYNWRVYYCAAVAAFCAVMIGYDSAFIGGTIAQQSFKSEFNWEQYTTSEANLVSANIVSVYQSRCFLWVFRRLYRRTLPWAQERSAGLFRYFHRRSGYETDD